MESGRNMLLHTILIVLVVYLFMIYVLKQSSYNAENRSLLLGCGVLAYMLTFGHQFPPRF